MFGEWSIEKSLLITALIEAIPAPHSLVLRIRGKDRGFEAPKGSFPLWRGESATKPSYSPEKIRYILRRFVIFRGQQRLVVDSDVAEAGRNAAND